MKDKQVKLPVEVINFCEQEALDQIVSWRDERFSPEQIVREFHTIGNQIPVIEEWDDMFIIYSGFQNATGRELANQFEDFFESFKLVAELATLRARVEVKEVN